MRFRQTHAVRIDSYNLITTESLTSTLLFRDNERETPFNSELPNGRLGGRGHSPPPLAPLLDSPLAVVAALCYAATAPKNKSPFADSAAPFPTAPPLPRHRQQWVNGVDPGPLGQDLVSLASICVLWQGLA